MQLKYKLPVCERKILRLKKYFDVFGLLPDQKQTREQRLKECEKRRECLADCLKILKTEEEKQTIACSSQDAVCKKEGKNRKSSEKDRIYDKKSARDALKTVQFAQQVRAVFISEGTEEQKKENMRVLEESMTSSEYIKSLRKVLMDRKIAIDREEILLQHDCSIRNFYLIQEKAPRIVCLLRQLNNCIIRQEIRFKKERKNLYLSITKFDETLEELFKSDLPLDSSKVSKNQLQQSLLLDSSDEEEPAQSITSPIIPVALKVEESIDNIQIYLENKERNKQLNGCLSQTIENYLQRMKFSLCKEVYDHILLGAAALENMAQAIYEGRWNHIALGFRSTCIHCHFAVEQMLCQVILKKMGLNLDSHNLLYLAELLEENTEASISQESKNFLEEIRVHLWFHYPEDYRLYFAYNKAISKAFSLLDTLFQSEISTENVKEAMDFSFKKYCQTLEFITNLSEVPLQNTLSFETKINDLQNQLNSSLLNLGIRDSLEVPLIRKMDEARRILNTVNALIYIQDFEEGWLLISFNTIKYYLHLMKISLETPQESMRHSLQRFILVETLLNMDKLFKQLFRAISILQLGKDNHAHDLKKFYPVIDNFYEENFLLKEDKICLEKINLAITHHYLHKSSKVDLKKDYECFLKQARDLLSIDQEFTIFKNKCEISYTTLQAAEKEIMSTMERSLDLFIKLLQPVIDQMEKINRDIEKEVQETTEIVVAGAV